MVSYPDPARLDAVFGALSDATRRAILMRLADGGPTSVTELAEPFDMSLPAVSKHLAVLERAGLVQREWDGRVRRSRFVAEPLEDASEWLEAARAFWEGQLDGLARYLRSEDATGAETPRPRPKKTS